MNFVSLLGVTDMQSVVMISLTVVLLAFIAFYSVAEIAIFSLSRLRLDYLIRQGNPRAQVVKRLLDEPDEFLASILIGNTIAHTLAPVLAVAVLTVWLGNEAGYIAASVGMTLLILFVGEIIPKVLASQYPERLSFFVALPAAWMLSVSKPFVWLSTRFTDLIFAMFGMKVHARKIGISRDELKHLVSLSREEGVLAADEGKMLHAALAFHDRRVVDIMIPREKIVGVDLAMNQDQMLKIVNECGYTRLPVYEGTIDNVRGIIHSKDLLNMLLFKNLIVFQDLMRDPCFISSGSKISEVLKLFQQKHLHVAVVRDAGGRIAGLVTMEDILEQIVGSIEDEHDTVS